MHSNLIPLEDFIEECNIEEEDLRESHCARTHHKAEEMKNTHMKANEGLWYINEVKEKRVLLCSDNQPIQEGRNMAINNFTEQVKIHSAN